MKHNKIIVQSLLVASLGALSACGGGKKGVVKNKVPCQGAVCTSPLPAPTANQNDYLARSLLPQMQQQYGSIKFFQPVTIVAGAVIPAGLQPWANVYAIILRAVSSSGCLISNTPYANTTTPLGSLNYNCFQSKVFGSAQIWTSSYAQFEYMSYSNQFVTAFDIINWFLGTGASYAQTVVTPQYGNVSQNIYNPNSSYYLNYQQNYGYAPTYDPYWLQGSAAWNANIYGYGYGQYQYPFAYNNGGYSISVFLRI